MAQKRLFKDTAPIDQPEGTWRYANNIIINDKKGSISNEGGTQLRGHLGTDPTYGAQNDKVIGAIQTLRVQLVEHQKQAEYHSTMSVKAQGAIEVLLQMHPELQENK